MNVSLGEILTRSNESAVIEPSKEYHEVTIRLWGKGIISRGKIRGAEIGGARSIVRHGQLILSKIDARNGAIGLVPPELDSALVSNDFPSYNFRPDAPCLPEYIGWLVKSAPFIALCQVASEGTTNRVRIREDRFLEQQITLPPISEQAATVAKLNLLADKTRQLNERLAAIEADSQKLLLSLHHRAASEQKTKVGDFLELREDQVPIRQEAEYIQVGVRSFGAGLFEKSALKGIDTSYRTFNRLYTDALVLSQVKGWEGALALCPESLEGKYVSPEYRTFQCIPGRAHPSYIGELVNTPWFWSLLQAATRGVGARRERTRPEQFLSIELPMPSFSAQVEISKILWRQKQMRAHFTELRAANDALIPATLERVFLR